MNAARSTRLTLPCSALALALALAAAPGCIGKRRPQGDDEATPTQQVGAARLIGPDDVDGKFDALVENDRVRALIDERDPYVGAAIPLVTIVEYSDFQCPFCSRLATTLEELQGEYRSDLKLVFKQFPLPMHAQAEPASRAALAAHEQGKFWELHDLMFANQRALSDDELEGYAREAGLDMDRFRKDFQSDAIRDHVQAEMAQGRALGVRGTPAFFVNGRFYSGAQPADQIRAIIEEELGAARKLLEAGAKREELYARFLHKAPALPGSGSDDGSAKAEAEPARPSQPGVPADAKPDPDHEYGEASRTPNYAVPVAAGLPSKGPADALVTIVEYGAFDCDDCRAVQPTLRRLLARYPNDVRLVFRQLAESTTARRSAQIALAAHRQGKFWEAHDRLLVANDDFTAQSAEKLAQDLGLDVDQFNKDLRERGNGGSLAQVQADLATVDVFRGKAPAPIFFVNGRYLDKNPSYEDFDALIQEEKAKAERFMAAKGMTDRSQLYETMRQTWRGADRVQAVVPEGRPQ
ncbi:DsbA family protein [Paraliomyxa miuraensis]|uniref:DsbA family protein n=1 Tax=Paraliomyxa miuraensis TaxID=376150 RepID=UPI002252B03A|nr:thioredoxin domain-containing protein [Paraliomyxa miuraensis]MCX4243507.1 thioredoxin domain-containing protein [Paraliomyxa miuraensis]